MKPRQLTHFIKLFAILTVILTFAGSAWSRSYKVLHAFNKPRDGGGPHLRLLFDAAGNLYGTAQTNGVYGYGVVYEVSPQTNGSWTEKVIYNFTGGDDGLKPIGNLIFDATGNLYSTTLGGAPTAAEWFLS